MINGKSFLSAIENLLNKIDQGSNCTAVCLLDYCLLSYQNLYDESNRLSKQQALDADPKKTQQINVSGNLD